MNQTPPTHFDKLFKRGTQLLRQGENERALRLLEKAHALDETHYDVALNFSGALILTKAFPKAVVILEALSEQYPHSAQVWTNLGAAYLGNPILADDEKQQKAIAAFKRALDLNPIAHSVAYNLGLIYRDRQEYEEAKLWFGKALQHNPHDRSAKKLLERLENNEATV